MAAALSADLTREGIAHAITGSIAMAAHGFVRGTLYIRRTLATLLPAGDARFPHLDRLLG